MDIFRLSLPLLIAVMMALTSCSKEVLLETDEESVPDTANSTLVVRTKAGADTGGDAVVSYPVTVYVFDGGGDCVAVTSVEDEESALSLTLPEGTYTVCAVGGASGDSYELPAEDDATGQSVVRLRDGKRHGDLMSAVQTVRLADGETNTLTLSMLRKVMLLQGVTISNVPSSVTAVSVEIVPLYESLHLNGTFSGSSGSQSVTLTKGGDSKVWKSTDEVYMLPASGPATITVRMATDDSTQKSYSYACSESLEANYKITIEGTYTGSVGVELSGTITGAEWAGERTIKFDFDDNGNSTGKEDVNDKEDLTGAQIVNGAAPKAMTVYEGTIVLSSEPQDDNTTVVKVMAPKEAFSTTAMDEGNQEEVKGIIDGLISKISVDGIEGWRLPTLNEIKNIMADYNTISSIKNAPDGFDKISYNYGYFYQETDGTISFYRKNPDGWVFKNSRLRAVATLVFKGE